MKKLLAIVFLFSLTSLLSFCQSFADVESGLVKGKLSKVDISTDFSLSIGDTLTLCNPSGSNNFNFVTDEDFFKVNSNASGARVVVKTIKVVNKKIVLNCSPVNIKYFTKVTSLKSALDTGELLKVSK